MYTSKQRDIKHVLDEFYKEYTFRERIAHDPIEFPHRYEKSEDIEVAGFIASCLAYGKVSLFKPVIEKILKPCGTHPANFVLNFSLRRDKKLFKSISYRFNKEEDILCLLFLLSQAFKKWGNLKNIFYHYYSPEHEDIKMALEGFINELICADVTSVYGKNHKPDSLLQLFPSPEKGSACKRINLFLRWMVRKKDIDFGIWDAIPQSKLIIPLDTHIAKISRCLGLTKRSASDWKTAKEITEALRQLDAEDPLKYDFALCHQGISGLCKGEKSVEVCEFCVLSINRQALKVPISSRQ